MKLKIKLPEGLEYQDVYQHYVTEKNIAKKLKESRREERSRIYSTMYDELFKLVPKHSRIIKRDSPELVAKANKSKMNILKGHFCSSSKVVEFAPGDGCFSNYLCNYVSEVIGVDISNQMKTDAEVSSNYSLVIYDGYNLDLQGKRVDVVFSDQLIEHLHPEDVLHHFHIIRDVLSDRGTYLFRTPHAFSGPHDISKYFSDNPEGFHLKEWTFTEIFKVLKEAKYRKCRGYIAGKGLRVRMPYAYFFLVENTLGVLPRRLKNKCSRLLLPSVVVGATV
jgi:2-polyprenyl-3-methyl-5-hydroxy-6-metoxy-1,4-benzoquinol methylase